MEYEERDDRQHESADVQEADPPGSAHRQVKLTSRIRQSWRMTSYWNILMVLFTAVIAFSNGCYGCYARKQFITMDRQLGEMQSAGKQTDQLIGLYGKQIGKLGEQVDQLRQNAYETHRLAGAAGLSAGAAQRANANAREQFEADERAWFGIYSVDVLTVGIALRNFGKTPAEDVVTRILFHPANGNIDVGKYVAAGGLDNATEVHTGVVFPSQEIIAAGSSAEAATELNAQSVRSGRQIVYMITEFTYYSFGKKHTTRTCGIWIPALNQFDSGGHGCESWTYTD